MTLVSSASSVLRLHQVCSNKWKVSLKVPGMRVDSPGHCGSSAEAARNEPNKKPAHLSLPVPPLVLQRL